MNPKILNSKKSKIKILNFRLPLAVRASRQTAEPTVLSPRFVLRQAKARTTKIVSATKHLENEAIQIFNRSHYFFMNQKIDEHLFNV